MTADPLDIDKRAKFKRMEKEGVKCVKPTGPRDLKPPYLRSSCLVEKRIPQKHTLAHLQATDTICQRGARYIPLHTEPKPHMRPTDNFFKGESQKESKFVPCKRYCVSNKSTDPMSLLRPKVPFAPRASIVEIAKYRRHRCADRNDGNVIKQLMQNEYATNQPVPTTKRRNSVAFFTPLPLEKRKPDHKSRKNVLGV